MPDRGQEREALRMYADRIEDDRREPDKILCHALSMRSVAHSLEQAAFDKLAAAREDTERPDETEPSTLHLRAAEVRKGDRIYARGDWWKVIGVGLAERHVTLTAESSDGEYSSSRTLTLDDPVGVVREDTERPDIRAIIAAVAYLFADQLPESLSELLGDADSDLIGRVVKLAALRDTEQEPK